MDCAVNVKYKDLNPQRERRPHNIVLFVCLKMEVFNSGYVTGARAFITIVSQDSSMDRHGRCGESVKILKITHEFHKFKFIFTFYYKYIIYNV